MLRTKGGPRSRKWTPGLPFDEKARAFIVILLLAMAFCCLSGLVGPRATNAFAAGSYTHVFPNGNSVQIHDDGTVSGTCTMTNNAAVDGVFGGTVTMPDGNSYHAACYERYLGVPNYEMYPGPCDGTYPFEATRNANGTYFVVIKSQNATHGAPGTLPSTYPYQRCYTEEWKLILDVEVSFGKESADLSITAGNPGYSLAGAVFDIHDDATDALVTTVTMDESGKASCRLAPNKKYYAVETKAPHGYTLLPGRIPFSVGNRATEVTFKDQPGSVTLTIRKRDAATGGDPQSGLSLKGAEYEVSSLSTPGWKATAVTDGRGVAVVKGIPLGKIAVTETKAPEGYEIDSTVRTYEVDAGQLGAEGVFELAPQDGYAEIPLAFDIDLVKYLDSGSDSSGLQKPGAGVRFLIISNSTGKTIGTITTDETGRATTAGRWFGKGERVEGIRGAIPYDTKGYTVREDPKTTPAGYQPCPEWTIGANQMVNGATLHYIVDNDFVGSRIQIIKHDVSSGRPVPLEGFSFQILDEKKQPITQEVWHPNHSIIDTFTTDETGSVTLPEPLKPGKYHVRETIAVAPYLINESYIDFEIKDAAETEPITVIRVADERARGEATISKCCSEGDCPWCGEEGKLQGATFDVVAMEDVMGPDGSVEAVKDQVMGTVSTNDDGVGSIDDLPLGCGSARYAFIESAPSAGHVLDPTPLPFTLTWKDAETAVVSAQAELKNTPTQVVVEKTDESTGAALKGAFFDIWPRQLEHGPISSENGAGSLLITNRSGKRTWDGVEVSLTREHSGETGDSEGVGGTAANAVETGEQVAAYTLGDFAVEDDVATLANILPGNYLLSISPNDDGGDAAAMRLTVEPGKSTHVQLCADGLRVGGRTLTPGSRRLLDAAFKRLGIPTSTDEQGRLNLKHLPAWEHELNRLLGIDGDGEKKPLQREGEGSATPGAETALTWCAQEIRAPRGYVADPTVRCFTVPTTTDGDAGGVLTLSISNDFTKVEISKRSAQTEEPLEGAQLEVTDTEGNVIDRWTSSSEPHRIERMEPGTYRLSELIPPQTHDDAEPLMFDVKPTTDVQSFSMYDEELSIKGRIDKRQEIVKPIAKNSAEDGDGGNRAEAVDREHGAFSYSLDYRNESSTWVDEFTVDDHLAAAESGMAELVGITTARAHGDRDGKLNVWYRTNIDTGKPSDGDDANATLSDGHENPWLENPSVIQAIGDDGRVLDYGGWRIWAAGVPANESVHLDVEELDLEEGEHVMGVRLEYGSVSKDFATREDDWDEPDIKDAHDDWNPISVEGPGKEDGGGGYAPTILHMRALEAYAGGCAMDNYARVALYRNGGGTGLESHDEDAVHQEAASRRIVTLLDQTGANPLGRGAIAAVVATGAITAYRRLRKGREGHRTKALAGMHPQRRGGSGPLGSRGPLAKRPQIPRSLE